MTEPMQAQENHDDVIERWKNSSPYEQERLELLQQAIAEGKEKQLYDPEEQKKFGLDGDEFLIYAHPCRVQNELLTVISIVVFCLLIDSLFFMNIIPSQVDTTNYIYKFLKFTILIATAYSITTILFKVTAFITNKNIHCCKNIYYWNNKIIRFFLTKIPMYDIQIRNSMRPELSLVNDEHRHIELIFDLKIIKYKHDLLKIQTLLEFSENKNSEKFNKKYKNDYILKIIRTCSECTNIEWQ